MSSVCLYDMFLEWLGPCLNWNLSIFIDWQLIKIASDAPPNLRPDEPLNYNCSCILNGNFTNLFGTILPYNSSIENGTYQNMSTYDASTQEGRKMCQKDEGELVGDGCSTPFYVSDVFFFSCILFLGTFTLAMSLKLSRNAAFFPTVVSDVFVIIFCKL